MDADMLGPGVVAGMAALQGIQVNWMWWAGLAGQVCGFLFYGLYSYGMGLLMLFHTGRTVEHAAEEAKTVMSSMGSEIMVLLSELQKGFTWWSLLLMSAVGVVLLVLILYGGSMLIACLGERMVRLSRRVCRRQTQRYDY